ncbi:SusC/RagA family TonB-linked outer membrane protein [Salinimicrobium sp. MT39]|uniref:SusC/RagA family TonB-linked outer membrane protein n=1 Tax=Salinimicrobium profundisediminis TaxID=2994553 RepID=A0A9X3CYR3_9FLAO|nr:SusC/RagA family TonB-linked outer membrane protein [Salinimicrobium profundisediminis]MCX2839080.1 SusC/RagA family TonB-linked outer membrane protein [Salinimicrobium profundisediminis]
MKNKLCLVSAKIGRTELPLGFKLMAACLFVGVVLFSAPGYAGNDMKLLKINSFENLQIQALVTGTVFDENGIPLPGASVVEEGTTNGVVTDFDGNFAISVENPNSILVVNYLGYKQQKIPANQEKIVVQLEPDAAALDEVVVVGYGTTVKRDVTGAVSSVSEDDLNQGAITNPLQQLVGKAAGVSINQTGSEPGSAPNVRIRGITSLIGGNDPLVVVDGIQGNMDLLNQIPPSEIASVDILKDASATAIYGSRGAPGVIIITTKKNKAGKSIVEFSSIGSLDFIPEQLDMLDANQWWQQAQKFEVPPSTNHGANTDWFNILTRTGATQNHTVAFGGGGNSFNYRASVSAILQQGVVINSNNRKFIGRITATQKALDDRLALTMNLNSGINNTKSSVQSIGRAAFTSNLISNAYLMRPTDPVFDVDGSYYTDPNVFQYINPYAVAEEVVNEGQNNNLFGSLNAEFELLSSLTATWFGSWRKTDNMTGFFLPVGSTVASAIDQDGFANINNNRQDEKLMNMSLAYKKEFENHFFDALALYEWQNQTYQGNYLQARGFFNDIATYNALQLGDLSRVQPGDISSYKNDRTLISFLGRVNYTFMDRYLLTLSYRRDGSSVFGENHKWGDFPAVAMGWRIDEEKFMEGDDFFDQLKLRAGYGVTGNQQGLYPQNSLSLVGAAGVTYFGGSQITNFNITQNANSDLRWETKKQANVGVDFTMLDYRLSGSIDAFTAKTDNLLFNYTVPQPPFPYGSIIANVGSIQNRGLELALSYELIRNDDLVFTLAGNGSLVDNEVLNLSGSINGVPLNTNYVPWGSNSFLIKGKPIGTFSILQHTGKDEANAETVLDRNGDGIIDQGIRSPDRVQAGSALPTYNFSINPTLQYKDFDFSMVWRGSGGNKIYNNLRQNLSLMENLGKSNVLESAIPLGLFTTQYGSDLWLEDGDFIRLENVTVGYLMQPDYKYIESVRISLTGRNLLLFTDYSGLDPELNLSGGNGFGGDMGIYPRTRSLALGLNVKFN